LGSRSGIQIRAKFFGIQNRYPNPKIQISIRWSLLSKIKKMRRNNSTQNFFT
jgi:hypothetical protein